MERTPIPAAHPVLALLCCQAIVSAGGVPVPAPVLVSGVAICCVGLFLPDRRVVRAGIIVIALWAGSWAGLREKEAQTRAAGIAGELAGPRFAELVVAVESSWWERPAGSVLDARDFVLIRGGEKRRIDLPIRIYAPVEVPARLLDPAVSHLRLKGAVGRSKQTGQLYVSVKSWRLVQPVPGPGRLLDLRAVSRRLGTALDALAAEAPERVGTIALVKAVALGKDESLDEPTRERFRRAGTYHLLVFSGLQIALAAALIIRCAELLNLGRLRYLVLIFVALASPPFAGAEPSVTRAALMVGLLSASRLATRPTGMENLLFVSLGLRLLTSPAELGDPGLWLTYAATGGLIFIGKPMAARCRGPLMKTVCFGLAAEVATTPLTLLFFSHYVLGGGLVTIAVAPLMTLVLAASWSMMLFIVVGWELVVKVLLDFLHLLFEVIEMVNVFSGEVLDLGHFAPAPPVWLVIVAFAAALLMILLERHPILIACCLAMPGLVSILGGGQELVSTPSVTVLDVGQGDAILLQDGSVTMLIDGGGRRNDPSFWRRVLVPSLMKAGVNELDVVVLSHPDADHCGGLPGLVERIRVESVWMSRRHVREPCARDLLAAALARDTGIVFLRDGHVEEVGEFRIEAIVPRLRYKRSPLNNGSVALRVRANGASLLLAGDLEDEAEKTLAEEEGERIRADYLKVGHHGARRSTTEVFLDAVRPCRALISVGRDNPFGHPHPDTLKRLRSRRVRIHRTDLDGAVRLSFDPVPCPR
ncbi:MAG: DNA internalization-related competence protein ComEC/Rec2 [Acidobacteria bacterium]|nr:DNA internalization-related competence protein ComEC/Rec2 [Acidobacteriota bacterium]